MNAIVSRIAVERFRIDWIYLGVSRKDSKGSRIAGYCSRMNAKVSRIAIYHTYKYRTL